MHDAAGDAGLAHATDERKPWLARHRHQIPPSRAHRPLSQRTSLICTPCSASPASSNSPDRHPVGLWKAVAGGEVGEWDAAVVEEPDWSSSASRPASNRPSRRSSGLRTVLTGGEVGERDAVPVEELEPPSGEQVSAMAPGLDDISVES